MRWPVVLSPCLAAGLTIALMLWPGAAGAALLQLDIRGYLVHVGAPRTSYFDGVLLTTEDLNREQSYQRSGERYIGPTGLDLSDLLRTLGPGDVSLMFEEQDAIDASPEEPAYPGEPQREDFIVLNPADGSWRGRLFLPEQGGIRQGVYADLAGRFAGLVVIAEPASLALLAAALAGLGLLRRHHRQAGCRLQG